MDTSSLPYDTIVVGTGPGGASAAGTLARAGMRVLLLERGSDAPLRGTLAHMAQMAAIPGLGAFFHGDGSLLVRALTNGGSTAINFATAADPPLARFAALGIDLAPALAELRAELPIGPLPESLIGPMAARITDAARATGLTWRPLDKMIRPAICRTGCWRCLYGCPYGAKWSARDLVDDAVAHGAHLQAGARVTRVLVAAGGVQGVEAIIGGRRQTLHAKRVILAAGGIGSARLLHASGLGPRRVPLFTDPVVAVMGSVDDINGGAEVPMVAGTHLAEGGITLSDLTLPLAMYRAFALQSGRIDRLAAHARTLSIMVKIRDQRGGAVGPRWVNKTLQPADRALFAQGAGAARRILEQAGARHIFVTRHFAAHPGGTLDIGRDLDARLETRIAGLHVCDASVLPAPWGLPPTLTLLCLGRRLGADLLA